MTKKNYLELLIKSYGLIPKDISSYRTSSNGGEYEQGVGWSGFGVDSSGNSIIKFSEPDGFNMAVYEILKQAKYSELEIVYIHNTY